MINQKKLTIMIPALNESKRIEKTLTEVYYACKETLDEFEILVIDDGSSDNTFEIATQIANTSRPEIKVIRQDKNFGLGVAFSKAVSIAIHPYITLIPADGAYIIERIKPFLLATGSAPVILGYRCNLEQRPPLRRFISGCVTSYVAFLTGKKIIDSQGIFILPVHECKKIDIKMAKYIFQMQVISCVLKNVSAFHEIPCYYSSDADKNSGMIKLRVMWDVLKTVNQLLILKFKEKFSQKNLKHNKQSNNYSK